MSDAQDATQPLPNVTALRGVSADVDGAIDTACAAQESFDASWVAGVFVSAELEAELFNIAREAIFRRLQGHGLWAIGTPDVQIYRNHKMERELNATYQRGTNTMALWGPTLGTPFVMVVFIKGIQIGWIHHVGRHMRRIPGGVEYDLRAAVPYFLDDMLQDGRRAFERSFREALMKERPCPLCGGPWAGGRHPDPLSRRDATFGGLPCFGPTAEFYA